MGCPLAENIFMLPVPIRVPIPVPVLILIHEIIVVKSLTVMEMRAKKNVLRNHHNVTRDTIPCCSRDPYSRLL